MLNDGINMKK